MLNVYFAFEGLTGSIRSCFGNTEKAIKDLNITRTAAGHYTCIFLTDYPINRDQLPIIQVIANGPAEGAGICNIVDTSFLFLPTACVFPYQITLDIKAYGGATDPDIVMVAYAQ
jgi:hypothetical protein